MLRRVVISGTFHRDSVGLQRLFRELEMSGCRILSPISIDFADTSTPVVKTAFESDINIRELQGFHLRAIRDTDLIWLHAPAGHVGISASYEIGFAAALRKPVYSLQSPRDEMLQTQVRTVSSVFEALDSINNHECGSLLSEGDVNVSFPPLSE